MEFEKFMFFLLAITFLMNGIVLWFIVGFFGFVPFIFWVTVYFCFWEKTKKPLKKHLLTKEAKKKLKGVDKR